MHQEEQSEALFPFSRHEQGSRGLSRESSETQQTPASKHPAPERRGSGMRLDFQSSWSSWKLSDSSWSFHRYSSHTAPTAHKLWSTDWQPNISQRTSTAAADCPILQLNQRGKDPASFDICSALGMKGQLHHKTEILLILIKKPHTRNKKNKGKLCNKSFSKRKLSAASSTGNHSSQHVAPLGKRFPVI